MDRLHWPRAWLKTLSTSCSLSLCFSMSTFLQCGFPMPNNKVKEHLICSWDFCQIAGCTVRAETSTQVFLMFIWSTQDSPFYLEGKGNHFTCMHKNHHVYQQFSIPIDRIASDFKVSVDSISALIWTSFVSWEGNHFLTLWSRNSVLSSEYWDLRSFHFHLKSAFLKVDSGVLFSLQDPSHPLQAGQ